MKELKRDANGKPTRVLVVQQINRSYRIPLLKKLSEQSGIILTMIHGTNPPVQAGDVGISISKKPLPFRTLSFPISGFRRNGREILWFGKALRTIKDEFFDVVITDHYTRFLSIWPMQTIQHRRNAGFILWGIGFHQHPTPVIDKVRKLMVKRTDALLLYSEKESKQYQSMGVPKEKCFVMQNTVDLEGIDAGIYMASPDNVGDCRHKIGAFEGPVLMHIGRLAKNKRLDILLRVLPKLMEKWPMIQLALIGEGPESNQLRLLANELSISKNVHFLGPITDHKLLAPWVLASDLIVAPAQIGLLAPMTLAYGRTLVISDVPEQHGPEVQAFIPGKTGLQYKFEDLGSLASAIDDLLSDPKKRQQFATVGSQRVRKTMGPERMLEGFLAALHYVVDKKGNRKNIQS